MSSSPFDAFMGGIAPKEPKRPEKAPVWVAKQIDGKYYVSLEQVLDLLEMNDVLPSVRRGLKRRLT